MGYTQTIDCNAWIWSSNIDFAGDIDTLLFTSTGDPITFDTCETGFSLDTVYAIYTGTSDTNQIIYYDHDNGFGVAPTYAPYVNWYGECKTQEVMTVSLPAGMFLFADQYIYAYVIITYIYV